MPYTLHWWLLCTFWGKGDYRLVPKVLSFLSCTLPGAPGMTALQTAACCKDTRDTFLRALACVQEAVCLWERASHSDLVHPSVELGRWAQHSFWCGLLPTSELVCRSVYCTAVLSVDTHLMALQNPLPCTFWNGDYCAVTQKHAFYPFASLLWVTGWTSIRPSVNILKALNRILKFTLECKGKQSSKDSNTGERCDPYTVKRSKISDKKL